MKTNTKRISTLLTALLALVSSQVMAKPVTVEHMFGTTELESKPQRVVVMGIGPLDALDYFGIDPVAVSTSAVTPDYLKKYTQGYASSGSLHEPDFESIFTQKPDLIITGPRASESYKELSEIAPTVVFAIDNKKGYWPETQKQWRMLGKIFEIEDMVEAKITNVDAKFSAIRSNNQSSDYDALTVMSSGGNISTFGPGSRFAVIYSDFGFKENVQAVKAKTHGDLISYEFIREKNPSTLLVLDKDALFNPDNSTAAAEFANDLIKTTKAYQQNRIAFLDMDAWYLAIAGVTATDQMINDVSGVSAN
ncbi:ABC transporter substrate-binding protein [Parasalinivibrio latis]|uniref:siderophore ABC transporter substrate-binding protein n=1 Tax=Parasalinivibrio latis TaxID=2952610 RepID=UPI0030DF347E